MATTAEAIDYLRSFDRMQELSEGSFCIQWILHDVNRTQTVYLRLANDLVVFSSPFAKVDDISANKALEMALIFGVQKVGDFYALRNIMFLEDLDESEIQKGIELLAVRADDLESHVGGDAF